MLAYPQLADIHLISSSRFGSSCIPESCWWVSSFKGLVMAGVWKGKRRDSFRQSPFCIVLLLFTSVWLHSPIFNFATSKQEPLNRVRERSGRALHTSAPRLSKLNGQERYLLGTISKAGKHGWPSVESNIANYSLLRQCSANLYCCYACRSEMW